MRNKIEKIILPYHNKADKIMQEEDKTPEQNLREACYKYLEEFISKPWNVAKYQSYMERKYGKQWALRVARQSHVDRKYDKQIALSVLRLIESLRNPSNSMCTICDFSGDCSAFSDEETE